MRLNPSLARTLRALREFEGNEREIVDSLNEASESPIPGLSIERLASDVDELVDAGMARVIIERGRLVEFRLTSAGRDYLPNRVHDIVATAGRYLFQLLCGAAGGLVVWLLFRWFG